MVSDELRRAFNRAVWGAADDEGQPARLGRRDGTLRYIDALGNSYADRVWVTLDGNHGQSETVARCTTVPHVRNLPVRVAMRRGLLTVIGTDGSWAAQYSGNRPIGAGPHAWMHGRLAPDALYVEGLQVLPLMATPTTPPSMAVRVQQAVYRYGGVLKLWETGDSPDLSGYVPGDGSVQHFVILCLDRDTNTLAVVDGADSSVDDALHQPGVYNQPFTATDVATIAIPDAYYPVCAVRFYHGMTRILAPDIIFDWRLWGGERGALDAGEITSGTLALERGGTEADLSATGPGLVQQRTAGAALSVVKCEFGGTAPPGTGDDETAGYAVGSRWLDTTNGAEYVCLDASAGAAVWIETTGGGGTLPDHDHSGDAGDGGTFDAANLTSGAAADGQVLTADGSGGAAWEDASGGSGDVTLLFSQIADATVANTTTETTLVGPGRGNSQLAAGVLKVGSTVRVKLSGYLSDTGNPTMDIKVKVGGSEVCSTGAQNLDTSVSEADFHAEVLITCRSTGASGTVVASGLFEHDNGTSFGLTKTSATAVDTTGALDLDVTATWGAADAANTITAQICTIELITASDDLAPAAPSGLAATEI